MRNAHDKQVAQVRQDVHKASTVRGQTWGSIGQVRDIQLGKLPAILVLLAERNVLDFGGRKQNQLLRAADLRHRKESGTRFLSPLQRPHSFSLE